MRNNLYYRLRRYFGLRYIAIKGLYNEYLCIVRHLGSSHDLYKNQDKLKARIIMNAHSIEKGLSLKNIRYGYGKKKIISLLKDIESYYKSFNDKDLAVFVLSIIDTYINFNREQSVEDAEIISYYKLLNNKILANYVNADKSLEGGYFITTKDKINKYGMIDFTNFVKNRHSIRNFTGENIEKNVIERALKIAEHTPSACNRQPWSNYVFIDKNKIEEILTFQTGARQFKDDVTCVILVAAKYSSFFGSEHHQPWVNGGMYAMNLIYALHSLGVGTTPLNMGFSSTKLKQLKSICDITDNEVPVVLIGCGVISDEIQIATSARFKYQEYTKFY